MRQSLSCLKCGHRRLWVVDHVDHATINAEMIVPMSVTTSPTPSGAAHYGVGRFQAIICAQCGYTEWYAHQLELLNERAKDPSSGVRLVISEPGSQGPYR